MHRLATGLRINRAADDAAGLAISEKMRAQIRGMAQSVKNTQDALSLFKIQESTLDAAHTMLQRMRELCIQAANDTLTAQERGYLQVEVNAIKDEINRLADRKAWLNTYQLDGTFSSSEVSDEGGGGALSRTEKIKAFDISAFSAYEYRPVRITVVDDATTQQLDTVATRSSHVQETFTGVTNKLTSTINRSGTVLATDPYKLRIQTALYNPVDAVIRLTRTHDGFVMNPADYQIERTLPIPELTTFDISLLNPATTYFTATGGQFTTNASTGRATLGGGVGTVLTRVQTTSFLERFAGDDDGQVALSEPGVTAVSNVQIMSGGSWVTLKNSTVGAEGETVYQWDGAQSVQVGSKQADGSIVSFGPYDIMVTASTPAKVNLSELGSAAEGDLAYTWDGNHSVTVGRKEGGSLIGGRYAIFVDYGAQENQYTLQYSANNKYRLTGGEIDSSGFVQTAADLYDGTDIPSDKSGSHELEVRIDGGAPEANYRFLSSYLTYKNVLIFNTGPVVPGSRGITGPESGATITVDYATPSGIDVDWTGATLGEVTNDDGVIDPDEAASNDGIYNDFWKGSGTSSIIVSQPNRNRTMSLTPDPSWTVQDLIDAFNQKARDADLEAEAYWDADASEFRIRPGTSGWKDRPVTGWEGSLYSLTMEVANIGPGASGDTAQAQNTISAIGDTPVDGAIRVTMDDTGEEIEALLGSTSNEYTIAKLGLTISIKSDATAGAYSVIDFATRHIQTGANATAGDRLDFTLPGITTDNLGIDSVAVTTATHAVNSIDRMDEAIKRITNSRIYFGSNSNRCERTINNLMTGIANTQQAQSLIRDADYAIEASEMVKLQIIQNAALSYLSQAHLLPKMMLKLIS